MEEVNNLSIEKNNSNKKIIVISIISFVILLLITILFIFINSNKNSNNINGYDNDEKEENNSEYKFDDLVDENAKVILKDVSVYKQIGLTGSMYEDR